MQRNLTSRSLLWSGEIRLEIRVSGLDDANPQAELSVAEALTVCRSTAVVGIKHEGIHSSNETLQVTAGGNVTGMRFR